MSNYTINKKTLAGIADAIRGKKGTSDVYNAVEMVNAIEDMKIGDVELNLAYGNSPPEDTGKLWVKAGHPAKVYVKTQVERGYRAVESVGSLPVNGMSMCMAAVGTKVYLFGGVYESLSESVDTIDVFDTTSNTLSTLTTAKLPTAMVGMGAAVVGTKIYLFGGRPSAWSITYLDTIYVFDTLTETLSMLPAANLPIAAACVCAAAVGTKIYLFGGQYEYNGERGRWLDTVHVFDTQTYGISQLDAVMPFNRGEYKAAVVGSKIYLFEDYYDYENTVHMFDTETNTMSALGLAVTRPDDVVVVGSKVFMIGYWNAIRVFDTENETVTVLDVTLPVGGYGAGIALVGTKVYRFGGYKGELKNGIYVFDTETEPLLEENALLLEIESGNAFQLIPGLELGITNVSIGNGNGHAEKTAAAVYKEETWVEI